MVPLRNVLALLVLATCTAGVGAQSASLQFYQAKLAFESGRYRAAGKGFSKAGKAGHPPAVIHEWMARVYEKMGLPERAIDAYQKAQSIGVPSDARWFKLATLEYQANKLDVALKTLEKLPESYEDRADFRLMRGIIWTHKEEPDKAVEDFQVAMKKYPRKVYDAAELLPEDHKETLLDRVDEHLADLASRPPDPLIQRDLAKGPPRPISKGRTRFTSEFLKKAKTTSGSRPYQLHGGGKKRKEKRSGKGIGFVIERRSSKGTSVTN